MKAKKWHETLTPEQRDSLTNNLKGLFDQLKQTEKTAHVISGTIRDEKTIKGLTIVIEQEDFVNEFLPDWVHTNCPDGWPDRNAIFRAAREYLEKYRDDWASTEPESPETEPEPEEKPYNSIDWTVAFTLALAYYHGKIDRDAWDNSKQRLKLAQRLKARETGAETEEEIKAVSGKRPYDYANSIYPVGTKEIKEICLEDPIRKDEKRAKDYEYASKLLERYF